MFEQVPRAALTRFDVSVLDAVYTMGNGEHTAAEIGAFVFGGRCGTDELRDIADSLDKMRAARLSADLTEQAAAQGMKDPDTGEPYTSVEVDEPLLHAEKITRTDSSGAETVSYRFTNLGGAPGE